MANIMKDVANALGVELEEEFTIEDYGKYKLTKDGLVHWSNVYQDWVNSDIFNDLLTGGVKIAKLILTKKEREYLSAVIKPFRDRIVWIKKVSSPTLNHEYIKICYHDHNYIIVLDFPDFKVGTMYKGIELDKKYTLEELGL